MRTFIILTAALALAGCTDVLMSMSDDPCANRPGCTAEFPEGNAGPATFTHNGKVIATWRGMTQAPR